jgi:hypothetical protein
MREGASHTLASEHWLSGSTSVVQMDCDPCIHAPCGYFPARNNGGLKVRPGRCPYVIAVHAHATDTLKALYLSIRDCTRMIESQEGAVVGLWIVNNAMRRRTRAPACIPGSVVASSTNVHKSMQCGVTC